MTKEYFLKIKYNPETEEVESIAEYIEVEETVKLCIDDKELDAPDILLEMVKDVCNTNDLGLT